MDRVIQHLLISISLLPSINTQLIIGELSTEQKQFILDIHNENRNAVANDSYFIPGIGGSDFPEASNMNELLWVWLVSYFSTVFCCISRNHNVIPI